MRTNDHIRRHHHITLNVGTVQEDYDFHTKLLGLKSVKKTALYDGDEPIHHMYYGNDLGDVGVRERGGHGGSRPEVSPEFLFSIPLDTADRQRGCVHDAVDSSGLRSLRTAPCTLCGYCPVVVPMSSTPCIWRVRDVCCMPSKR